MLRSFIIGAVILCSAIPVQVTLRLLGLPRDVGLAAAVVVALIGAAFQVRAFWTAHVERRKLDERMYVQRKLLEYSIRCNP